MNRLALILVMVFCGFLLNSEAAAETDRQIQYDIDQNSSRLNTLESRLSNLMNEVRDEGTGGAVLFLFGAFCALWAQNTGRSAWLWFFLGLFFSVVTVIFLLVKNSNDKQSPQL